MGSINTLRRRRLPWLLVILLALVGCDSDNKTPSTIDAAPDIAVDDNTGAQLAVALWQLSTQTLAATQQQIQQLHQQLTLLLDDPTPEHLSAAQKQWRISYRYYLQFSPFLYLQHPQATELDGLSQWRFTIAAWPMQPGYLDSFDVYAHSGIVNDISLPLTAENVRRQHGLTDTEEVTLGLHAIEFLLWGDQGKATAERFSLQTKVPLALAQSGLKQEELPNNRRRELLLLQSELLLADINTLQQQWQTGGIVSRAYDQLNPSQQLQAMQLAMATALEELTVLLNNHGDANNNDHLYFNRFAGQRSAALSEIITTLQSVYRTEAISLVDVWIPDNKQPLTELLTTAKDQLSANNLSAAIESLLTIKPLLAITQG